MNVKQIVIAHLKAIGADGLCTNECGCGLDDLMPCASEYALQCKPAKKYECDRSCGGCCDVEGEPCYRPMETPAEEEETHL